MLPGTQREPEQCLPRLLCQHSFNKHLFSTYYVSGTLEWPGNIMVYKLLPLCQSSGRDTTTAAYFKCSKLQSQSQPLSAPHSSRGFSRTGFWCAMHWAEHSTHMNISFNPHEKPVHQVPFYWWGNEGSERGRDMPAMTGQDHPVIDQTAAQIQVCLIPRPVYLLPHLTLHVLPCPSLPNLSWDFTSTRKSSLIFLAYPEHSAPISHLFFFLVDSGCGLPMDGLASLLERANFFS